MERVTQRESNDCGVACVAMIIQRYAGCPQASAYDAAKAVMFRGSRASYTDTRDLRIALRSFGIEIGHRSVAFAKCRHNDVGLNFDAIIKTKPNREGYWHWLVWDSQNHVLLDPNPKKKTNSHKRAHYYLRILKP
jgi:ABC-type bacteriocin/lantibiotic exporter with double-glycine peptidase domain